MKHIKLWLATMAVLLGSITMSAATYSDWTSTNQGQDSSTSSNTYNITASAGDVLTFDWLVSSESNYDKLIITIGGTEILNKSGEQSGTYQHTFTSSGSYTMVVKYTKDESGYNGSDYAKVYNVALSTENSGDSGSENVIASGTCGDNLTWELNKDGELTIEGIGEMVEYAPSGAPWYEHVSSIRNVVIKENVTSIGDAAFRDCSSLTAVIISESVTSIGKGAFGACSSLTSIIIPESVMSIEDDAFHNCYNLSSITIPENSKLTLIGERAFAACFSLTSINIPKGITSIKANVFQQCSSLTSINIPESVTSIENNAFAACSSLTSINIPEKSKLVSIDFYAFGGCCLTSFTIPEGVTSIGDWAFSGCSFTSITCKATTPPASNSETFYGVDKSIVLYVPSASVTTYQSAEGWKEFANIQPIVIASGTCGDNLTWKLIEEGELIIEGTGAMNNFSSGSAPWASYGVSKITIKDGVASIGDNAFYYLRSLTSVSIPESVQTIGSNAFAYCERLRSIVIPEGVTTIGDNAFYGCNKITSVSIPKSVTSIGYCAFESCTSLANITIPEGVKNIGHYAFEGCTGLTSITIPESMNSFASYAFKGCSSLVSITFLGSVGCSNGVFSGCTNLTNVYTSSIEEWCKMSFDSETRSSSPLYMAENLYVGTELVSEIVIPNTRTYINDLAFCGYERLTSVVIPEGMEEIGEEAFWGCKNLSTVTCYATTPPDLDTYSASAFGGISSSATLYVPKETLNAYKSSLWNRFFSNIEPIVNIIASGTCGDNLTWRLTEEGELIIEGEGEMTEDPWWCYRSSINRVTIKEGVTSIIISAFNNCSNLTSIVIPESVTSVGSYLYGCSKLVDISVGSIEWWLKYGVSSLRSTLANNVNLYIGEELLTEVEIPSTISSIPYGAFRNCTNVVSFSIPESITAIGQGAFDNTGWYINQPDGVLYVGNWLYGYKGEIPEDFELVVQEGTKGIVDYAFEECTNLIRVTTPESIQYIGEAAFISSGLILVTMSEGVKSIASGAFWGCRSLIDVAIPESVMELGDEAFAETAWYRKQPCGVLYLSNWAVGVKICGDCENCAKMDLSNISIFEGVKGMAKSLIRDCQSVIIPGSVVYLSRAFELGNTSTIVCKALTPPMGVDEKTFDRVKNSSTLYVPAASVNAYIADEYWGEFDNIKAIDFPVWTMTIDGELIIEGVGAMENYLYEEEEPWFIYHESINSVTIKEGITSVGNNAFSYCEKITSVSLPNSLQSIGEGAFAECRNLTSVVIPQNVSVLGNCAFYYCGLSYISCMASTPPAIVDRTFQGVSKYIPVYVPLSSVGDYKNADYWSEFTNIQAMPETVTIGQYGSGTYCSEYALDFSEMEGLKAYAATGYDSETGIVTLTRVMTAKAGEGLFIKGEPGDYVVPVLESTSFNTLNMLVGTLEQTELNSLSSDGLYANYKYTVVEGEKEPLFHPFADGSTLSAGKAYLQIPVAWLPQGEARAISYRFDEGTTSIDEEQLANDNDLPAEIYDLMGRRVAVPQKGSLYIINNEKVIY